MEDHKNFVTSVAYSPSGDLLASGSWDGTVKLSEPGSGRLLQTLKGHSHWVNSIAFSPDARTLASGSVDQTIILWNMAQIDRARSPSARGASMSSDGRMVAAWDSDGGLAFWNPATGARRSAGRVGVCGALSPNGKLFAAGAEADLVKVWDTTTRTELATLAGHEPQKFVTFSPDGATIVTGVGDGLRIWDVANYEQRASVEVSRPSLPVYQYPVAFSPDSTTIATAVGSEDGQTWNVNIWDATDGTLQSTFGRHSTPVAAVAFSPTGETIASASHGGSVRLWDAKTGQLKGLLRGHIGGVYAVAFSPQGDRLVSGGSDGSVKVWDLQASSEVITLRAGTSRVFALQFTSDGQKLLATNEDETLHLWLAPRPSATEPLATGPDSRANIEAGARIDP